MTLDRFLRLSEKGTMRHGLETTEKLRRVLGFPDYAYTTIHVAGTNGKGSVATKIARSLQEEGRRVGLFTSPHLLKVGERIQIDGAPTSQEELEVGLTELFRLADAHKLAPTYFELCTALALHLFAQQAVDYAVIEVGMGGRLDATNVISPELTVITSIGLDHRDQLGGTLEEIAREKAGIVKKEVPLVLGPKAQGLGIEAVAEALDAPLHRVEGEYFDYREENSAIARAALKLLKVSGQAANIGCQQDPIGRFQVLSYRGGTLLLDAAHNPAALGRLFPLVGRTFPDLKRRLLAGFTHGHDVEAMVEKCRAESDTLALVNLKTERAHQMEEGAPFEEVWEGELAQWDPEKELLILTGSCYLLAEFFESIKDLERRVGWKIDGGSHTIPSEEVLQPN